MWSALDNDNNEVSDEVMERYKHMVAATEYTSLSRMGYENCIIEGMKPFTLGRKLVSGARTLRYLPIRPDLVAEVRGGEPGMPRARHHSVPRHAPQGVVSAYPRALGHRRSRRNGCDRLLH